MTTVAILARRRTVQTTTIVEHGKHANIYKLEYTQLSGKTIKSIVSGHGYSDKPTPDQAFDITITFTDGTELCIEEGTCSGYIEISYNGE